MTRAKVAAERLQAPPLLAVIDEYTAFVRATFGPAPDVLADFGLAPPKAPVSRSATQNAIAAAKGRATRAARHTMSEKQKKRVKGAISASLVVTPLDGSGGVTSSASAARAVATSGPTLTRCGGKRRDVAYRVVR